MSLRSHQPHETGYPVDVVIASEHSDLKAGSRVLLNQIKSINKQRIGQYIGALDAQEHDRVERAIMLSLGFVTL